MAEEVGGFPEFGWEPVVEIICVPAGVGGVGDVGIGGVDGLWWWHGVGAVQGCCPVGGAVGVAGVEESAAVFGAVVVVAFCVQAGVAGLSAGGFPGAEGVDVVDLAAVGGLEAAGGAAGAVSGDDELLECFRWVVAGAAIVQDGP